MFIEPHCLESSQLDAGRRHLILQIQENNLILPPLPEVAQDVLNWFFLPDTQPGLLVSLLDRHQSLKDRILRITRSEAFGGSPSMDSIPEALTHLGAGTLGEISLAISLEDEIFRVPDFTSESREIWRLALGAAVYGKEIACMKRFNLKCQFFVGLFHLISKPILLKLLSRLNQEQELKLAPLEILVLCREYHAVINDRLTRAWHLPDPIGIPCANYQDYGSAPSFQKETAMTWLSHCLAHWAINGEGEGEWIPSEDFWVDPVFERLSFYPDEIQELRMKKSAVLKVINALSA